MSQIRPFRAYRPKPELAAKVASVPYDVINTEEARELAKGNPASFLHVGRPEIDFDKGFNIYDERVYQKGAENLQKLIKEGTLIRENAPALYVYQQRMGDHVQAGIVATVPATEYEQGKIKIHEHTRKDKEDDRTKHVSTQKAHSEPVFLTYHANREIDAIVNKVRSNKPVYDFTSADGIGHAVWVISGSDDLNKLSQLFAHIPALYVADGHHRTAAAVRNAQAERAKHGGKIDLNAPHEWFMAVIFPHNQLKIMGYHRVLNDLNGLTPDQFMNKIREKFDIEPANKPEPDHSGQFGMFLNGKWQRLTPKKGTFSPNDPIKSLDVSILQDNLLAPILGIEDPRTSKRIDFVGGIRGSAELERRCKEGCALAFCLAPVTIEQLLAVADADKIMPPKSTWFEPKLRSGLTVRLIED